MTCTDSTPNDNKSVRDDPAPKSGREEIKTACQALRGRLRADNGPSECGCANRQKITHSGH